MCEGFSWDAINEMLSSGTNSAQIVSRVCPVHLTSSFWIVFRENFIRIYMDIIMAPVSLFRCCCSYHLFLKESGTHTAFVDSVSPLLNSVIDGSADQVLYLLYDTFARFGGSAKVTLSFRIQYRLCHYI